MPLQRGGLRATPRLPRAAAAASDGDRWVMAMMHRREASTEEGECEVMVGAGGGGGLTADDVESAPRSCCAASAVATGVAGGNSVVALQQGLA
jgi:hypothetical protein